VLVGPKSGSGQIGPCSRIAAGTDRNLTAGAASAAWDATIRFLIRRRRTLVPRIGTGSTMCRPGSAPGDDSDQARFYLEAKASALRAGRGGRGACSGGEARARRTGREVLAPAPDIPAARMSPTKPSRFSDDHRWAGSGAVDQKRGATALVPLNQPRQALFVFLSLENLSGAARSGSNPRQRSDGSEARIRCVQKPWRERYAGPEERSAIINKLGPQMNEDRGRGALASLYGVNRRRKNGKFRSLCRTWQGKKFGRTDTARVHAGDERTKAQSIDAAPVGGKEKGGEENRVRGDRAGQPQQSLSEPARSSIISSIRGSMRGGPGSETSSRPNGTRQDTRLIKNVLGRGRFAPDCGPGWLGSPNSAGWQTSRPVGAKGLNPSWDSGTKALTGTAPGGHADSSAEQVAGTCGGAIMAGFSVRFRETALAKPRWASSSGGGNAGRLTLARALAKPFSKPAGPWRADQRPRSGSPSTCSREDARAGLRRHVILIAATDFAISSTRTVNACVREGPVDHVGGGTAMDRNMPAHTLFRQARRNAAKGLFFVCRKASSRQRPKPATSSANPLFRPRQSQGRPTAPSAFHEKGMRSRTLAA